MIKLVHVRALCVIALLHPLAQSQAPAVVLPDRDAVAYEIYSLLLQHSVLEDGSWPRKFWLIDADTRNDNLDPRLVEPPPTRVSEAQELFADYRAHAADVIHLDASRIQARFPVRLADAGMRKRFTASLQFGKQMDAAPAVEFDGIPSIDTFSQVFFNPSRTLAMVFVSEYCGGLCANARWVVLERKDGEWKQLPWVHTFMIS